MGRQFICQVDVDNLTSKQDFLDIYFLLPCQLFPETLSTFLQCYKDNKKELHLILKLRFSFQKLRFSFYKLRLRFQKLRLSFENKCLSLENQLYNAMLSIRTVLDICHYNLSSKKYIKSNRGILLYLRYKYETRDKISCRIDNYSN